MISKLKNWLTDLGTHLVGGRKKLRIKSVNTHPIGEQLPARLIFVVRGGGVGKWAYLHCPCGCNNIIRLSLMKTHKPRWRIQSTFFGSATIFPSVRCNDGCYSHFWVRRGHVDWCADTGRPFSTVNKGPLGGKAINIVEPTARKMNHPD